jgi:hypothetical protein
MLAFTPARPAAGSRKVTLMPGEYLLPTAPHLYSWCREKYSTTICLDGRVLATLIGTPRYKIM